MIRSCGSLQALSGACVVAMNVKNKDWARASAMRGTCPDMCPERERYMREDRHQLSVYETIPGTDTVRE